MIFLELFLAFLEVGLFSFGGAYAAIPLVRDVVMRYGWITEEQLLYFIGISESTPGPIMVNLATYIGASQGGIPGAVIATLTVVLPAFVIILAATKVLERFMGNAWVKAAMGGLKPCVVGIILATGLYMVASNALPTWSVDWRALCITAVLALCLLGSHLLKKKLSPILLIVIGAVAGMVVYAL